MDRVRLGRALGYGARHAVKTLAQAVDAATAPNPAPTAKPAAQPVASVPQPVVSARAAASAPRAAASTGDFRESVVQAQRTVAEAQRTVSQTQSRVRGAAKQAGKSALAPVAKFSSVLWLEVTGTFFALVAFAMGEGIWRLRAAMKLAANDPERMKLYACVALMALFAYFAVSNFVRASRRQRR